MLEESTVENFPNMGKEIATQLQEDQRVQGRINPRRNMPKHSNQIDKNERQRKIIKSKKGKMTNNIQETPIRLTADFSAETLQARREWNDT